MLFDSRDRAAGSGMAEPGRQTMRPNAQASDVRADRQAHSHSMREEPPVGRDPNPLRTRREVPVRADQTAETRRRTWLALRAALHLYARTPSALNAAKVEAAWQRVRRLDSVSRWRRGSAAGVAVRSPTAERMCEPFGHGPTVGHIEGQQAIANGTEAKPPE